MSHKVPEEIKKQKSKARGRKFYEKNRELTITRAKEWAKKNFEKRKKWKSKPLNMFKYYKSNAERRNKTFSLTVEEITVLTTSPCFYCGATIDEKNYYNGIDRKDNSIGYEFYNCVSCCSMCNQMKHTLNINDFIEKCTKIVLHQNRMSLPN